MLKLYGGFKVCTLNNQTLNSSADPWNYAVREPELAIYVIRPNPNFRVPVNVGRNKTVNKIYIKLKLELIHGVDRIPDCNPVKGKSYFDLHCCHSYLVH